MKKVKFILALIFFLGFINVKAINNCSSDDMARLKEIASNVEFKSSVEVIENEENGIDVRYSIKVINMNDDLKILYRDATDGDFELISVSDLENFKFPAGTNLEFKIYSYTASLCTNELLRTVKVNLANYNYYYAENKDKCAEYPNFEYCKEFKDVSYDDFEEIDRLFEEYLKKDSAIIPDIESSSSVYYVLAILGGVVIVAFVVFVIIYQKKHKKKKLDI